VDEARSAIETNRLIARELGSVPAPRPGSASTPESRAAAETRRIIARELGSPVTPNSTGLNDR
jgi:hypothetical protein